MPTTSEVSSKLDTAKEVLQQEAKKKGMFTSERMIATDAAEFVESTKEFIEEKNRGEIFQEIVKDAANAVDEMTKMISENKFFSDRYQMVSMQVQLRSDARRLAQMRLMSLKSLFMTLVNSGQFRTLLSDLVELTQTIYRQEMQAAPKIIPGQTQLPISQEAIQFGQQATSFGSKVVQDFKEGFPMAEDKKLEVKFRFNQILKTISSDPSYKSASTDFSHLWTKFTFICSNLRNRLGNH